MTSTPPPGPPPTPRGFGIDPRLGADTISALAASSNHPQIPPSHYLGLQSPPLTEIYQGQALKEAK